MAEQKNRRRAPTRRQAKTAHPSAQQNKRRGKPAPAKRNSESARPTLASRLVASLVHHRHSAIDALARLRQSPGQSLPTCTVIAIALALPALLYLALSNLGQQADQWQATSQLSVYTHRLASTSQIDSINSHLATDARIREVRYISPAEALVQFQTVSGFGDVLTSLDDNPLPGVFVVDPEPLPLAELQALQNDLRSLNAVETVQLDLQWVQRLQAMAQVAQRLVTGLAGFLALGVVLIVGNVIRLAISHRKDEIVVSKLVGASDAFVRRPFLYTGFWYGLLGGVLALVMLNVAQWWLSSPIEHLTNLYQSDFKLRGLGFAGSCYLVLGAAVLGSMGAWLSVGRRLSEIKPE